MRARAHHAALLLALVPCLLAPEARAEDDAGAPSTRSLPSGASGAVIVPARGDEAPAPPAAPVLAPPKVSRDEGVLYPRQALDEGVRDTVVVDVLLDIAPDGRVRDARVQAPVGHGFDEAALAAAKKLEFTPATRNGAPIAARFKHRYTFAPPPSIVRGKVVSRASDARPLAGAQVSLRAADGREENVRVDAEGGFVVEGLAPGAYHLVVRAPGRRPQEDDLQIAPAEEQTVTYRLEPEGVAPPLPGEAGDASAGVAVEEVTVRGEKPPREVTKRTLEQRELTRIPGTNGDALRALQNLPGVARPPGIAGLLIVRGSAPQDTQVFVDGTLVPLVYHFGGLSSVIPSEMLGKIDFYPGNFSTQYGRGMGGIVDVSLRDPKKELHGLAQVDLIDARVLAEGPIFDTGWTFTIGGRRSYVDTWLKPVLNATGAGVSTAPVYYDYQALVQKDFNKKSSFRLAFFGSDDRLEILVKSVNASDPSLTGGIGYHTGFWRLQARYVNKVSDDTELRLTAAAGQDFIDFSLGDNFFKLDSVPISGRAEVAQKLSRGVTMNVGLDMLYTPYTFGIRLPPPPRPGQPLSGPPFSRPALSDSDSDALYQPAIYSELEVTPWRGGRIVPGLRLDYTKDTQQWDLAPRFIVRQDLTSGAPRTTLKGGVGVFFQPPQPQETNRVFGVAGLVSNRALQYDVGVEQELTRNVDVSFEGFYKQLDDLVTQREGNVGTGRAFGTELLLRYKPDARFFGWLAYTLSRSERRDDPLSPERSAAFDQTHILTVLGSYRLGRGWEIGGRFRLVSGNMYTPQAYGFFDENSAAYLPLTSYPPYGQRLPLFHQLDIRVDKTWNFKAWRFAAYLDVQNVYNQGNVEGISYNYNATQRVYATGLPILPSLGARAEF